MSSGKPKKFRLRKAADATASENPAAQNDDAGIKPNFDKATEEVAVLQDAAERVVVAHIEAKQAMYKVITKKRNRSTKSSAKEAIMAARARHSSPEIFDIEPWGVDHVKDASMPNELYTAIYAVPRLAVPPSAAVLIFLVSCLPFLRYLQLQIFIVQSLWHPEYRLVTAAGLMVCFLDYFLTFIMPAGLLLALAYLFACLFFLYTRIASGTLSRTFVIDRCLGLCLVLSLLYDIHYGFVPIMSVTIFVLLSVSIGILFVQSQEHLRKLIWHSALDLAGEDGRVHWFMLCLRLGVPGLGREHSSVSRHLCSVNVDDEQALHAALCRWLTDDHAYLVSSFDEGTIQELARYMMSNNLDWIMNGAPLTSLRLYYGRAKKIYMYDRFLRPYICKLVAWITLKQGGKSAVDSGWKPSTAIQSNTTSNLWQDLQVARNPRFVAKNPGFGDCLREACVREGTIVLSLLDNMLLIIDNMMYDILYNSAALGLVLNMIVKWLEGSEKEAPSSDDQDETENKPKDPPSWHATVSDYIGSAPFYLTAEETKKIVADVFGPHNSLTKSARLDACLFYGSTYLKPEN